MAKVMTRKFPQRDNESSTAILWTMYASYEGSQQSIFWHPVLEQYCDWSPTSLILKRICRTFLGRLTTAKQRSPGTEIDPSCNVSTCVRCTHWGQEGEHRKANTAAYHRTELWCPDDQQLIEAVCVFNLTQRGAFAIGVVCSFGCFAFQRAFYVHTMCCCVR